MTELLYKVLDANGHACNGGRGRWALPIENRPGRWMPAITKIVLCRRGYHLCRSQYLIHWLGPAIWEAECRGKLIEDSDKIVAEQARLLRRVTTWTDVTARLFAADCAEHVLPIFEKHYPKDQRPRLAIQAARDYANGKIRDAAGAAAEAARDAAGAAAEAARDTAEAAWDAAEAARDAAGDAAGAAAGDAAEAARDAAWDAAEAARDAAWDAWAAEFKWQTKRLLKYLKGRI